MKKVTGLLLGCLLASPLANATWGNYGYHGPQPPIKLRIQEPKSNRHGLLLESGWNLGFRLTAKNWVGYLDTRRRFGSGVFQALILKDPDDCLDMSHVAPGATPFDNSCAGPDEIFVKFTSDRIDTRELADSLFECSDSAADALLDDALVDIVAANSFGSANKVYLTGNSGDRPAGTRTGVASRDCYGYGVDDDLPGLVVMIDIGAARFFDLDFNPVPAASSGLARRLKNSAGLLSNVGSEFSNRQGETSIVAHMRAERGMFEPIAIYDVDVADSEYNYARRVDGGDIEYFNIDADFDSADGIFNGLKTLLPESYFVTVRAVVVEGAAPAIIKDMDGNNKFTAKDVELMGYTLLSNQAYKRLRIVQREKLDLSSDLDCVAAEAVIEGDLDDSALLDVDECGLLTGDGSSRSVRRRFL